MLGILQGNSYVPPGFPTSAVQKPGWSRLRGACQQRERHSKFLSYLTGARYVQPWWCGRSQSCNQVPATHMQCMCVNKKTVKNSLKSRTLMQKCGGVKVKKWLSYSWFRASWLYIYKIQQDATVCRYLFTANLLYKFRVSITPIIRST
jgi:hypothetical protein